MARSFFLGILFAILFSEVTEAQELQLSNPFPNLTFYRPLFLTHAGDHSNRVFVVRQDGFINVFPNDSSVTSAGVFLNISRKISSPGNEEGLLGLAFPPDFRTTKVFYINYTTPSSNSASGMKTVVARYTVSTSDSNRADSTSEVRLLEIEQPFHNHNGGMLAFGPDSNLYIGVGDGGDANDPFNNGQTLTTLLGKILRIDVGGDSAGYAIPRDNPFASDTTGRKKEIWAFGVRNPWRFSFDSLTGQLWLGDVGQGAREEVDIVTRGGNYGWKIMEGSICRPGGGECDTSGLTLPIADFGRDLAQSITGGYVYRGSRLPQLNGAYIFGDFVTGNVFLLRYERGTVKADSVMFRNSFNISSFGVDEHNELYVMVYADAGRVLKLTGTAKPTSVDETSAPVQLVLRQNYPNPFNPTTKLRYSVGGVVAPSGASPSGVEGPAVNRVRLVIYDLLGRQVASLVDEAKAPGEYEATFDGSGLSSGVYYYRLTAGDYAQARMMMLLK